MEADSIYRSERVMRGERVEFKYVLVITRAKTSTQ